MSSNKNAWMWLFNKVLHPLIKLPGCECVLLIYFPVMNASLDLKGIKANFVCLGKTLFV